MSAPSVRIDLDRLLTPISGARPAGESLRYTGVYDEIQEARREDDPDLPQGVWKTSLKRADWGAVERIALDALETRSKDLQIAVWLLEAWLHLYGPSGVVAGLRLLAGLSESFWDTLHPELDGDDVEPRLAPLDWMEEKLSEKLKGIAVTWPESQDAPVLSLLDWESARHLETLTKGDAKALDAAAAAGKVTLPKFLVSVSLTPTSFYLGLREELRQAFEALRELGSLLESRCGDRAPTLHRFAGTLGAVQHMVARILEERAERGDFIPREEEESAPEEGWDGGEELEAPVYAGGPIRSRAEAYRRLSEAADYLLRTEPHSPAPYLIKRAVAWGGMSLSELLQELVQSDNDLRAIYTLLGMRERS